MDETKHPLNPRMRHETTDINVWAVGKFGIALVIVTMVSLALVFGLMKFFQSEQENRVANTIQPTKIFPQPQLQQTPILDLRAIRAEEDKMLNGYAWVDQPKGVVRIPVAEAIDILVRRGLRPTPFQQPKRYPSNESLSCLRKPSLSGLPGYTSRPVRQRRNAALPRALRFLCVLCVLR